MLDELIAQLEREIAIQRKLLQSYIFGSAGGAPDWSLVST
jgi:hypothetical protein